MTPLPPDLRTERLLLRPFRLADAPRVRELAGDRRIAATTLNIPHPYEAGMAEQWIQGHPEAFEKGRGVTFAVVLQGERLLIGAIGLSLSPEQHRRAELGYWIGVPFWGQGYCTEAARAVVRYAFDDLGLHKITARHLATNPASGRVMQKLGMRLEGELVDETFKDGAFHTLVVYGLIRPA